MSVHSRCVRLACGSGVSADLCRISVLCHCSCALALVQLRAPSSRSMCDNQVRAACADRAAAHIFVSLDAEFGMHVSCHRNVDPDLWVDSLLAVQGAVTKTCGKRARISCLLLGCLSRARPAHNAARGPRLGDAMVRLDCAER